MAKERPFTNADAYPGKPEDINPNEFGMTNFGDPEEYDDFDDTDSDLDEIETELSLVFVDDGDESLDYADCEIVAADILGTYSFEEIMDMNELTDEDVIAMLFERGDIGLPSELADEEVQDLPPEEAEED